MRIWSLHPRYLDAKGLVALWRETLLAKHVLEGKTKGYKKHPQLQRFRHSKDPLASINQYLAGVYVESLTRGYTFNKDKFSEPDSSPTLTVTQGQINYELNHLLKKLKLRDPEKYQQLLNESKIDSHPIFTIIEGEIEDWEIIS